MKKRHFDFKLGEKTRNVWAGDLVVTCEYLGELSQGRKLFWDIENKCFRRVFNEIDDDDGPCLNGWDCADRPSKLI